MADLGALPCGDGGVSIPSPGFTQPVDTESNLGYINIGLMGAHIKPLVGPTEFVAIPATLPRPTYSGYQVAPVDQTVRTDLEVGTARQRRRTTARNDHVTVVWMLTEAQMADFRSWFDGAAEANGGAAWFTGLELALGNGGIAPVAARFTGPFTANLSPGQIWDVQATLEVR